MIISPTINRMNGIECVLYHLTDSRLTQELADYYNINLKSIFPISSMEIKRMQFCINLGIAVIGSDREKAKICDIGPGRRLFSGFMSENEYQVTAIDAEYYDGCEIENDYFTFKEGTITTIKDTYDYTFCFEVLEHNNLSSLEDNINSIKSITTKKAIISLPYYEDPVSTKGHFFSLNNMLIKKHFKNCITYVLYREIGFSYIFFVVDCED